MNASFVYEAIKHLTARSQEEILANQREVYEERLKWLKDKELKSELIKLQMLLEKSNITSWLQLEKNHYIEIRINDRDPETERLNDEAYKSFSFDYLTNEMLNKMKNWKWIENNNIREPVYAIINREDGKILSHSNHWYDMYCFILEKKNIYLEKRISDLQEIIDKLKQNKVKI